MYQYFMPTQDDEWNTSIPSKLIVTETLSSDESECDANSVGSNFASDVEFNTASSISSSQTKYVCSDIENENSNCSKPRLRNRLSIISLDTTASQRCMYYSRSPTPTNQEQDQDQVNDGDDDDQPISTPYPNKQPNSVSSATVHDTAINTGTCINRRIIDGYVTDGNVGQDDNNHDDDRNINILETQNMTEFESADNVNNSNSDSAVLLWSQQTLQTEIKNNKNRNNNKNRTNKKNHKNKNNSKENKKNRRYMYGKNKKERVNVDDFRRCASEPIIKINDNNNNNDNDNRTNNKDLLDALPDIAIKFDALFPFYRMTDKDCKKLSLLVYFHFDKINRIFCNSIGRCLETIIYYKNSLIPEKLMFVNRDDNWNEVKQWKDIKMNTNYCLKEMGYIGNNYYTHSVTSIASITSVGQSGN